MVVRPSPTVTVGGWLDLRTLPIVESNGVSVPASSRGGRHVRNRRGGLDVRLGMRRRSLLASIVLAVALGGCGSGDESVIADSSLTTAGADRTAGGAPVLGDGLTAEEAIDSDAEGLLLVTGYLFVKDGNAKLCDGVLDSYPPQCGDPSLLVEGLDIDEVDGLLREGGMAWTDDKVSLLGEVVDGIIRVTSTSAPRGGSPPR